MTLDEPSTEAASSALPTQNRPAPRDPRWYRSGLVAVAVMGLLVRLVNVVVWRPSCNEDLLGLAEQGLPLDTGMAQDQCFRLWGDSFYYFGQGRLLAKGEWFVSPYAWIQPGHPQFPSSSHPPLFSMLLGAFAKLGITTGTGMRIATGLVGVIGVVLLATLVRRLAGPRAALIGGVIAAVYPMLWINDGMLLSESLYVPLVLLVFHAAYSFWERPSLKWAALLGAALGVAALTRSEALLLLGLLPLPLLWGLRLLGWRHVITWGATTGAVGLAVLAPWLAFNLVRFEHPALMTASTGAVLSAGNCDGTYYGSNLGYTVDCFGEYVAQGKMIGRLPGCTEQAVAGLALDPRAADACWPSPREFDETGMDRFANDLAMDYMGSHRSRLPVVMVARVGRMWDLYVPEIGGSAEPLGQNVRFNWQIEGRGQLASQAGLLGFYGLLPLAVVGTVALWRRRIPVSPLLSMTILITVTAALTFGVTRYRVPVDVVVVVLAAVGIDAVLARLVPVPIGASLSRRRAPRDATVTEAAPGAEPDHSRAPDSAPTPQGSPA